MPPKHRDIAPFLQKVREFLLGREHVTCLRYADTVSPRSIVFTPEKAPVKLSDNPYYLRSARALVRPPVDVIEEHKRKMAKAAKPATEGGKDGTPQADRVETGDDCEDSDSNKLPAPGEIYRWD